MKQKRIIAIVIVIGIGVLCGCTKESSTQEFQKQELEQDMQGQSAPTEYQFDATVLSTENDSMMVEALEGQTVVGEVKVWIGLLDDTEMSEIKAGDTVRITHDGKMTMSIPPQMSAVELTKIKRR